MDFPIQFGALQGFVFTHTYIVAGTSVRARTQQGWSCPPLRQTATLTRVVVHGQTSAVPFFTGERKRGIEEMRATEVVWLSVL